MMGRWSVSGCGAGQVQGVVVIRSRDEQDQGVLSIRVKYGGDRMPSMVRFKTRDDGEVVGVRVQLSK